MYLVPSVQNLRPAVFLTAQVIATAGARLYLILSSLSPPSSSFSPQQKNRESLRAHRAMDPLLNPHPMGAVGVGGLCNLQHIFPAGKRPDLTHGDGLRKSCRLRATHGDSLSSSIPK